MGGGLIFQLRGTKFSICTTTSHITLRHFAAGNVLFLFLKNPDWRYVAMPKRERETLDACVS